MTTNRSLLTAMAIGATVTALVFGYSVPAVSPDPALRSDYIKIAAQDTPRATKVLNPQHGPGGPGDSIIQTWPDGSHTYKSDVWLKGAGDYPQAGTGNAATSGGTGGSSTPPPTKPRSVPGRR
jgi:hypothetical protein